MTYEDARYVERTPWPHWAEAILWGALVLTAMAMLAGWDTDLPLVARMPIAAGFLGLGLVIRTVAGGMTVRVDEAGILVHLGAVPLLHRRISFEEILDVDIVQYKPIREFGGWGIRGLGKKKAWTARGNRAVRLHLTEDRLLYLGSDVPNRLAERIRTIGRARLGVGSAESEA